MSFLDRLVDFGQDLIDFEHVNIKEMWKKVKDDPERLFIGAIDPFSSKMWGEVTGKDYDPIVNQWGGPADSSWARAEEEGVNLKPNRMMHGFAEDIAQFYAIGYGTDKIKAAGQKQGMDPDWIDKGIEFGQRLYNAQKAGEGPPEEVVGEIPTQPIVGGGLKSLEAGPVSSFGLEPPEIETESGAPGTIAVPGAIPTFAAPVEAPPEQFGRARG